MLIIAHQRLFKSQVVQEHNKAESGEKILTRILAGESCVLVTDAGMPAISDPGEELVAMCAKAGIKVYTIPGPCAAVCALSLSGLPTGRFCFEGFLSTAKKSRFQHLESLKAEQRTMIFYEAPHKLLATLTDMLSAFGDRRISVCRELTKLHEETLRLTLSEPLQHFTDTPPRGEFVLVIEGAAPPEQRELSLDEAAAMVRRHMEDGLSRRDAVRRCAEETGFPRNILYDAALQSEKEQ
jgi:16S rRNA (cytidine1402-2'-O)-methyltransferase